MEQCGITKKWVSIYDDRWGRFKNNYPSLSQYKPGNLYTPRKNTYFYHINFERFPQLVQANTSENCSRVFACPKDYFLLLDIKAHTEILKAPAKLAHPDDWLSVVPIFLFKKNSILFPFMDYKAIFGALVLEKEVNY